MKLQNPEQVYIFDILRCQEQVIAVDNYKHEIGE
jgi:hypothetical protein